VTAAAMLVALVAGPAVAQRAPCVRGDFETVVADAATALRELTDEKTPLFQQKLRALKDKRRWSHDQFMAEAAPLVQDDRIAELDQRSGELLARINGMGAEGTSAAAPNCRLLADLKASMQALVDTQKAKWAYMLEKVEKELAR
jgi:hypothetical protein